MISSTLWNFYHKKHKNVSFSERIHQQQTNKKIRLRALSLNILYKFKCPNVCLIVSHFIVGSSSFFQIFSFARTRRMHTSNLFFFWAMNSQSRGSLSQSTVPGISLDSTVWNRYCERGGWKTNTAKIPILYPEDADVFDRDQIEHRIIMLFHLGNYLFVVERKKIPRAYAHGRAKELVRRNSTTRQHFSLRLTPSFLQYSLLH